MYSSWAYIGIFDAFDWYRLTAQVRSIAIGYYICLASRVNFIFLFMSSIEENYGADAYSLPFLK